MEGGNSDNRRPRTPENPSQRTADIVSNMALAHELVMNDQFKLEEFPENSLEKHVKDIVHKAFWEKLKEDLQATPPDYSHTLTLIAELKENLLSLLLPHHKSWKIQINEVLDVELIKQQIEHNILDLKQCAHFVVNILAKLCAPARDKQVQDLLHVNGVVDMFREIFSVIDIMKMDMANFQLQSIKPQLLQQSIEYERKKFSEYLEANPAGLSSTEVWLGKGKEMAVQQPKTDNPTPDTPQDTTDASPAPLEVTKLDLLAHSYLGIIFGEPGWPYPETLIMDELRLAEMRASIHRSTLLSTIVLVTMQTAARQLKSDSAYMSRLKAVLIILLDGVAEGDATSSMPNIYEQVKEETNKILAERGFPKITEEQDILTKGQIMAMGDPNHQLRKLISKRAYNYMLNIVKARLRHGNGQETGHEPVPPGLEPVKTEISELAIRFGRLVSHNSNTYGSFYESLISNSNSTPGSS